MNNKNLSRLLPVFFWFGLWALVAWAYANLFPARVALPKSALIVSIFMIVFYGNRWMVRLFFFRKKYLLYVLLVLALVTAAVLLRTGTDRFYPGTQLPLQKIIAKQRPYAGPVLMMCGWVLVSLSYEILARRSGLEKKYREETASFAIAQNQFLKSQINPHFLFNNLNNIYSLIQTGSPHAGEMVLKLSELLRYSVYRAQEDKVTVKDEMQQIMHLADLYRLREGQQVQITVETHLPHNAQIEPMLLIPLVENCFKHGNIDRDPGAYIKIKAESQPGRFYFSAENSTDGHQVPVTGGVGLSNIRQRMALVYGPAASLETFREEHRFTVELNIVWNKH